MPHPAPANDSTPTEIKPQPITITNIPALRLAIHLANQASGYGAFQHIKLEGRDPDDEAGRMMATDGFSFIVSDGAHDSLHPTLFRTDGKLKLLKGTTSVTIDPSTSVLTEHGSKEKIHKVTLTTEEDVKYPDVDRVTPNPDKPATTNQHAIDVLRGGRMAEAYGKPVTGTHLYWMPTSEKDKVYLHNTDDRDLVILVSLRHVNETTTPRWKPEA